MSIDSEMWYMDTLLQKEVSSVKFYYSKPKYYAEFYDMEEGFHVAMGDTPQEVRANITELLTGFLPDGY